MNVGRDERVRFECAISAATLKGWRRYSGVKPRVSPRTRGHANVEIHATTETNPRKGVAAEVVRERLVERD